MTTLTSPRGLSRTARAAVCLTAACSHACTSLSPAPLATRDDYRASMAALREGDPRAALADLPTGEASGFISQVERGWLGVLAGAADPGPLVKVGRDLEARKTFRVSKEAKAFFYKEAHDGYFPAEHEAILLHVVAAMAFAAKGQKAEAIVETRAASRYLQNEFSPGASAPFDDPGLRLWLAALWTGLGEWASARIDLRVAARLDPRWKGLAELAERPTPPAELSIVFSGAGPDIEWVPEAQANLLKGVARLRFTSDFPPTGFLVAPPKTPLSAATRILQASPTAPWYARHQERELAIKQVVEGSGYALRATGSAALAGATYTLGVAGGVAIMALGVGVGGLIVYGALKGLSGSGASKDAGNKTLEGAVYLGLLAAGAGIGGGLHVIKRAHATGSNVLEKGIGQVNSYRYVRFLPDFVGYFASDQATAAPVAVALGDEQRALAPFLALPGVHFFHYADHPKIKTRTAFLRTWVDDRQQKKFVYLARTMKGRDAEESCQALAKDDTFGWRLPTWQEIQDAYDNGMTRREENPGFGPSLARVTQLWTGDKSYKTKQAECRRIDLGSLAEYLKVDCQQTAGVVCAKKLGGDDLP